MIDPVRRRIGRPPGIKNSEMQARAVRTRETILAAAARHFDTAGYSNTSITTIQTGSDFARGSIHFHFPTKKSIAEQLISDWNHTLSKSIHGATNTNSSAAECLTAIFLSLARHVAVDTNLRAGMKLSLDPALGNGSAFTSWVDDIDGIVKKAITSGEFPATAHLLALNLCSGTIGAAHASSAFSKNTDLVALIEDTVTAHLRNALTPT